MLIHPQSSLEGRLFFSSLWLCLFIGFSRAASNPDQQYASFNAKMPRNTNLPLHENPLIPNSPTFKSPISDRFRLSLTPTKSERERGRLPHDSSLNPDDITKSSWSETSVFTAREGKLRNGGFSSASSPEKTLSHHDSISDACLSSANDGTVLSRPDFGDLDSELGFEMDCEMDCDLSSDDLVFDLNVPNVEFSDSVEQSPLDSLRCNRASRFDELRSASHQASPYKHKSFGAKFSLAMANDQYPPTKDEAAVPHGSSSLLNSPNVDSRNEAYDSFRFSRLNPIRRKLFPDSKGAKEFNDNIDSFLESYTAAHTPRSKDACKKRKLCELEPRIPINSGLSCKTFRSNDSSFRRPSESDGEESPQKSYPSLSETTNAGLSEPFESFDLEHVDTSFPTCKSDSESFSSPGTFYGSRIQPRTANLSLEFGDSDDGSDASFF